MANEVTPPNVLFKVGTQDSYNHLEIKDSDTLYFIEDTKRIYKGEYLYSGKEVINVKELPVFDDALTDVIYLLISESGLNLYIKGDTDMVPLSAVANVSDGSISSTAAFSDDVLVTSSTDLLQAGDDTIPTSGAVKEALKSVSPTWEKI